MSAELIMDVYEVDVIFDAKEGMQMKTLSHSNFVGIIEDTERFLKKFDLNSPEVLSARFFTQDGIVEIKQKVIETIKARRKNG